MNTVILKGADHLQTRAVADMGQSRIPVASKVSLKNISLWGPVENGAPRFQLTDACRGLFRVDFGHTPDVQVLAPAHRIREMNFPIVGQVDRAHHCRDAAFCHYRLRSAEQSLASQP